MNDLQLRQNVLDELEFAPDVDAAHIGVAAAGGVVTLTGHVKSFDEKLTVEDTVRHLKGVKAIASELAVRYPWQIKTADDEIAQRGLSILHWSASVPEDSVQLTVQDGWVTMTGTVDWQYQKLAAETHIRKLSGVKGVVNNIAIKARIQPSDVKQRIENALKRNAEVEARAIRVSVVDGGAIKLEGQVHDWREREAAERAAWSAPGVIDVRDLMTIG